MSTLPALRAAQRRVKAFFRDTELSVIQLLVLGEALTGTSQSRDGLSSNRNTYARLANDGLIEQADYDGLWWATPRGRDVYAEYRSLTSAEETLRRQWQNEQSTLLAERGIQPRHLSNGVTWTPPADD